MHLNSPTTSNDMPHQRFLLLADLDVRGFACRGVPLRDEEPHLLSPPKRIAKVLTFGKALSINIALHLLYKGAYHIGL